MFKKIIFLFLWAWISNNLLAQNYFQQEVNYNIDVSLNDKEHTLTGKINIEYINHSPDTLSFLYFHLWPNAYKNNQTAFAKQLVENEDLGFYFSEYKAKGFIDNLDFTVNKQIVNWRYDSKHIDICKILLNKFLLPGDTILIQTPFFVKIPSSDFSRLGHQGQAYNITQWYPKPAVYDKNGWHPIPYLDQGEFFSEFGQYDVKITVPQNYVVAATGNLTDSAELSWINEKVLETKNRIKQNDFKIEDITSSQIKKTLHFHEEKIHDFAWFANKEFFVLKGNIELPHTKRKVNTWIYFTQEEAHLWKNAIEYVNDAVYYYSLWNGDYPYKNCTAVNTALAAGGGMEYPTITNIGYSGNARMLEIVIAHEVGHNWFYGILGSNERVYPYLDEGINSFYEMRYVQTKYPGIKLYSMALPEKIAKVFGIENYNYSDINYYSYLTSARKEVDQPIIFHSNKYSSINYFTIVYQKSALAINYLKYYLGDSVFDDRMQHYFNDWKFKHPDPEALMSEFNNSGKNLDWFFNDVLFSTAKVDYKIKKYNTDSVLVVNKAKLTAPFKLTAFRNNDKVFDTWESGFRQKKWIRIPSEKFDKIVIDADNQLFDLNRGNNTFYAKKIIHNKAPFKLQFAGLIENPQYEQLNYLPLIGFNYYDKLMPGILLYNNLWPPNKFEYQFMPFYSFKRNKLSGSGNLYYSVFPKWNLFREIEFHLEGKQYGSKDSKTGWHKIAFNSNFYFSKVNLRSPYFNMLSLKAINTSRDNFIVLNHNLSKNNKLNAFSLNAEIQASKTAIKSFFESNFEYTYQKNSIFSLRLFAGKFLWKKNDYSGIYNFRLSGFNGWNDYLFENIYLGRDENFQLDQNNSFLASQINIREGGFAIYSPVYSEDWLISLNLTSDLPINTPVQFYLNIATFKEVKSFLENSLLFYEFGLMLNIGKGNLKIYFPFVYSSRIDDDADLNNYFNSYSEKIRFIFNIDQLNPFKLAKNFVYF